MNQAEEFSFINTLLTNEILPVIFKYNNDTNQTLSFVSTDVSKSGTPFGCSCRKSGTKSAIKGPIKFDKN